MSTFYMMAVDPFWTGGWAVVCCKLWKTSDRNTPYNMFSPSCIPKYLFKVLIPSLLSDLEPMQRQGSLLQWLLLAHFVPVPADCVCRWADWRWSPRHGSSEQGLHHPVCPDDPPFETGSTRGIVEWRVREWEKRREEKKRREKLSISTLEQKLKTLIVWCGLEKKKTNKHLKHKIKAIQMQDQLSHFSLSCKSQRTHFLVLNWILDRCTTVTWSASTINLECNICT